jgi:hypothetical protein
MSELKNENEIFDALVAYFRLMNSSVETTNLYLDMVELIESMFVLINLVDSLFFEWGAWSSDEKNLSGEEALKRYYKVKDEVDNLAKLSQLSKARVAASKEKALFLRASKPLDEKHILPILIKVLEIKKGDTPLDDLEDYFVAKKTGKS